MNADELPAVAYLAALSSLPGVGPHRLRALLADTSPQRAWERVVTRAPELDAVVAGLRGVSDNTISEWTAAARSCEVQALWARHVEAGVDVVVDGAPGWPLRDELDPEPPTVLFGRGPLRSWEGPSVAIVGTRRCTRYGLHVAADLGAGLAARGIAVVSGVASGIDGAAQRAALDAGGPVIGVVGSGLDVVYPASNRRLWSDLCDRGRLWSEAPLGTEPARWRFPARNRVIAALANVVVVVESAESGGSLHTVDAALERDRLVMAVPGPITSPTSVGTNRLLLQGCAPVTSIEDIEAALGFCAHQAIDHEASDATGLAPGAVAVEAVAPETVAPKTVAPDLERVLYAIGFEATSTDQIVAHSGLGVVAVLSRLGSLQAEGLVVESGGWWQRA